MPFNKNVTLPHLNSSLYSILGILSGLEKSIALTGGKKSLTYSGKNVEVSIRLYHPK